MDHKELDQLLDQLQDIMERHCIWQTLPPVPERMMSTIPFSMDTLAFSEWLQWIYISRLRALIEAKSSLPRGAQVYPYAEECLKAGDLLSRELLDLILKLDKLLS